MLDLSGLDLDMVPEGGNCLHDYSASARLRVLDLSKVVQKGGRSEDSLPLVLPTGLSELNLARAPLSATINCPEDYPQPLH